MAEHIGERLPVPDRNHLRLLKDRQLLFFRSAIARLYNVRVYFDQLVILNFRRNLVKYLVPLLAASHETVERVNHAAAYILDVTVICRLDSLKVLIALAPLQIHFEQAQSLIETCLNYLVHVILAFCEDCKLLRQRRLRALLIGLFVLDAARFEL